MVARDPESALDCVGVGEKEQARRDAWAGVHLSSCENYALCHGKAYLSLVEVPHVGTHEVSMIPWWSKCLFR